MVMLDSDLFPVVDEVQHEAAECILATGKHAESWSGSVVLQCGILCFHGC